MAGESKEARAEEGERVGDGVGNGVGDAVGAEVGRAVGDKEACTCSDETIVVSCQHRRAWWPMKKLDIFLP